MARDSGGTYSLPAGNPVVTGTAISSTMMNDTLNDLKTELTDSLCRSGKGAMLAPLPLFDGTVSLPGLAWGTDTDTGFYRIGAGNIGFAINGVKVLDLSATALTYPALIASAAIPYLQLTETDAAADEKGWQLRASGGDLFLYTMTDAGAAAGTPLTIVRTGTAVDSITFNGTTIALTGNATVSGSLLVGGIALTPSKGSFTIELATETSGGSVIASGTAYWEKHGNICTVMLPYLAGVTTDIVPWIRGIPAAIVPSLTGTYIQQFICKGMVNGSPGIVTVGVTETTYWEISGASATFTSASAEKGVGELGGYGPTITYLLGN